MQIKFNRRMVAAITLPPTYRPKERLTSNRWLVQHEDIRDVRERRVPTQLGGIKAGEQQQLTLTYFLYILILKYSIY